MSEVPPRLRAFMKRHRVGDRSAQFYVLTKDSPFWLSQAIKKGRQNVS